MPSDNNVDVTGVVHTSKTEANAIVRQYISHIEELKESFKENYDEMEMENTDIQVDISEIVADITNRLERLVDSMQDITF